MAAIPYFPRSGPAYPMSPVTGITQPQPGPPPGMPTGSVGYEEDYLQVEGGDGPIPTLSAYGESGSHGGTLVDVTAQIILRGAPGGGRLSRLTYFPDAVAYAGLAANTVLWAGVHFPLATAGGVVHTGSKLVQDSINGLLVGSYNNAYVTAANAYDSQAAQINANPAVQDPVGFVTPYVMGAVTTITNTLTSSVKTLETTAAYAQAEANRIKVQTVDPALAGAVATVGNAVTQAGIIVNNTLIAVNKAVSDTNATKDKALADAQTLVNNADDMVLAEAAKVQAEVTRIKTTTVDPAVANATQIVTGTLTTITTAVSNLRAEVDRIVASAPGQVDKAVADATKAVADTTTLVGGYVTTVTNAANQIKTGTVDPTVASIRAIVDGYLAGTGPIITNATKTVGDAVANYTAQIAALRAQAEAEAQKQQQAATKTVTDTQVFIMGQVANLTQILLAQVGNAVKIANETVASGIAEVTRVLGVITAQTVDRPLFYGTLSSPVTIGATTDVVVIPPGGLTITAN